MMYVGVIVCNYLMCIIQCYVVVGYKMIYVKKIFVIDQKNCYIDIKFIILLKINLFYFIYVDICLFFLVVRFGIIIDSGGIYWG